MLAIIGCTSADATYFVRIFLIWIFAMSGVVLVVLVVYPTICLAVKGRKDLRNPLHRQHSHRKAVSTLFGESGFKIDLCMERERLARDFQ